MTDHQDIARVVRSVTQVLLRKGWTVRVNKSNRSLSRYVRARRGCREITVRVSDHKYNGRERLAFDFHPNWYSERHFAGKLSNKRKHRRRK